MSRRMLLEDDYRENGLMPVMDGLVCWLDGRDGKNGDTIWKDRSKNGNDFELNGFTFSGEDGWTGKSLKVNFSQYAIKNISLAEEYTIEADLFVDGGTNNQQTTFFYFGDGNRSGIWRECIFRKNGVSTHHQIAHNNRNIEIPFALKRYNLTIMGKRDKIYLYVDNIKQDEYSKGNVISGLTANFYLGCGVDLNRFSKARFNSVKIYNKVLTEEEIQQNYQYEQSIERGE